MVRKSFDYIIVGAGSAGCVLANRLSADPACRVLLLEAGPRDLNPLIKVPLMAGRWFMKPYINWDYYTEPQAHMGGRKISWPRGKVWGGSSSINGMIYARGNPADFDGWAQTGLRGWSWDKVRPYFQRAERFERGGDQEHGVDGPLPVSRPKITNPLYSAFVEAAQQAGHAHCADFNGADPVGVGNFDYNILHGQRWSAARAYLAPVLGRPNLVVASNALSLRLVLNGTRAAAIEVRIGGQRQTFEASHEILLSAGVIGSPAILLHSGIGDAAHLREVGVPVKVDLQSVGRNLHDHMQFMVTHATDTPDGVFKVRRLDQAVLAVLQALATGTGPATVFPTLAGAFLKSDQRLVAPDIQLHFILGAGGRGLRNPLARTEGYQGNGFNVSVCQLHPESRGAVSLKSNNPLDAPAIQPNYLSTANDRRLMREGMCMARDILSQSAFDQYRGAELKPGKDVQSDADVDRWIAANAQSIYHPVGSCRMGADPDSTVDEALRVRGVEGLRVIDASVMPSVVGANTHAATVMIAERGADLILGRTQ